MLGGAGDAAGLAVGKRTGLAASKPDQQHAAAALGAVAGVPAFMAAGPAFDARKVMQGKSILSIPGPSSDPWYAHGLMGMREAAQRVGYPFSVLSNSGKLVEYQQGFAAALLTKPTLIDLYAGPDPVALGPQVRAAEAKGIKVAVSHNFGIGEVAPNTDFNLPVDFGRAARLMADWVILHDPKAHVLVVVSDELPSTRSMRQSISEEFQQYGGTDIQHRFVNVPIPQWASGIGPAVQSALSLDPQLTYIICIYDSMAEHVVPVISAAKAVGRVHVVGFNGTPHILDLIRSGEVEMSVGESTAWVGYAVADAEMRVIAGQGAVKSMNVPFRVFTRQNVAEAGIPASFDKGYGDAFRAAYAKLWMLP